MLGPYEAQIRSWLEAEPTLSAPVVLQRPMNVGQRQFTNKSLRTVQMAVKASRQEPALEILNGDWMTPVLPPVKSFGNILR
ncbi:hypothetical protein [Sinorhizobium meliloti]|uniref:hypothetical protein n=1 Tax=Rhizobium meliloti TaxID=382 RepID=UPI001F43BBB6|nr:hypothetical protein [Sinorhizobium meliloti]